MSGLPSASLVENARFNALVVVPNAVQGLFKRRRTAVAAATRANVDGWAVGLLSGMRRGHSGGPVWVRVARERALLLLSPGDVHRALEGSPDPFASDPPAKRDGMCAFQPDALTISRGELWRNRRDFAEAVLDTAQPEHRFAARFAAVAAEEASALADRVEASGGELGFDAWNVAFRRITRRVVFGDAAADDTELFDLLDEMMGEGNGMPGKPSARYPAMLARIGEYAAAPEEGSLVSLFESAPSDADTRTPGQAVHWLFATGDTLAANSLRALALIASHPRQRTAVMSEVDTAAGPGEMPYLGACLHEAMRLWPTTPMLARQTTADTEWQGVSVPAGTQVVISNTFLHRDTERHPWADHFSPDQWIDRDAASDWSFNHFSRGPQGCPGAGLAVFLGTAVIAEVLRGQLVTLRSPSLDPTKPLPHMLDYFGLRFTLAST